MNNINSIEKEGIKYQFSPEWMQSQLKIYRDSCIDKKQQYNMERNLINHATKFYSKKFNLEENLVQKALEDHLYLSKEPIDLEASVKACLGALRSMSPKLNGLMMRENDNIRFYRELNSKISLYLENTEIVNQKLEIINIFEMILLMEYLFSSA